jgi:hypothetical protein
VHTGEQDEGSAGVDPRRKVFREHGWADDFRVEGQQGYRTRYAGAPAHHQNRLIPQRAAHRLLFLRSAFPNGLTNPDYAYLPKLVNAPRVLTPRHHGP